MIGGTFRAGNSAWTPNVQRNHMFSGTGTGRQGPMPNRAQSGALGQNGTGRQRSMPNRAQSGALGQNMATASPAFRNAVTQLGDSSSAMLKSLNNMRETGSGESAKINAFRDMANSFNALMRAARESGRGSNLERELNAITQSFETSLHRIGISINHNGTMRIDEERMRQAAENGDLGRFATRTGINFLKRLTRTAENVSRNPASFVDSRGMTANMFDSRFISPQNQMNSISRTQNTGMLFNTLG